MSTIVWPAGVIEALSGIYGTVLLGALSLHAGGGTVDGLPLRPDVAMTIIITGMIVFGVIVYDMYRQYTRVID